MVVHRSFGLQCLSASVGSMNGELISSVGYVHFLLGGLDQYILHECGCDICYNMLLLKISFKLQNLP